jgi:hypothetical protein
MSIEPPVERLFDTKDQLVEYCKAYAISQGYVDTKARGEDTYKVYLKCFQGVVINQGLSILLYTQPQQNYWSALLRYKFH